LSSFIKWVQLDILSCFIKWVQSVVLTSFIKWVQSVVLSSFIKWSTVRLDNTANCTSLYKTRQNN
jgi:hypothetical protein